jgi:hypothetical protein
MGRHELALGGLDQSTPLLTTGVGVDLERRQRQPGPATRGLREGGVLTEQALSEQRAKLIRAVAPSRVM